MGRHELELVLQARISFKEEPWGAIAAAVLSLAEAHFAEVDGGVEPRRGFAIDSEMMEYANNLGHLRIYAVRVEGLLAGYCTWSISFDVESKGLMIATQGAWYVDPAFAPHGPLGLRLFKYSLGCLKSLGVRCVYPHHRLQGRGTPERLGRWLIRQGAKPIKLEYSLWIGD